MTQPFEVLAECPHCRVESAVVTVVDPADTTRPDGVIEQRCRMCGWTVAGAEQRPPADLRDPEAAMRALAAFAAAEGEDVEAFCRASIGLPPGEVVARLVCGDPVPTNFDAMAWLFGGSLGGGARAGVDARTGEGAPVVRPPPLPVAAAPPPPPRVAPRALASVMVADGEIKPPERAFADRWLAARGLPAIAASELRVWRPEEIGRPEDALVEPLLDACIDLTHLDQEPDEAEWRVVVAYGRAWGVGDDWLAARAALHDRRYATGLVRVWRALGGLVRTR